MDKSSRAETGKQGEALAKKYLEQNGYTIVVQNWRYATGEIDLVAREGQTLVFIEVRTRHASSTEAAFASITPRKRQRLIAAAHMYLHEASLPADTLWRIDVIGVALGAGSPVIDHAEDALGW